MKKVIFRRLSICNFLSIGNEAVVIEFERGINIITGRNVDREDRRNGVGKSTVIDALYFSIFGSTLRDLKKDMVINNINHSVCQVGLEFTVVTPKETKNFEIVRTLGPNKCYLFCEGDDITRDSMANTNKYISEIISSNENTFQNCVIMTINGTTPFMAQGKVDKRKFIEGIFNLGIFSDMSNHVKREYNTDKKDLDIEITRFDEKNNTLNALKEQYENEKVARNEKLAKYKKRQTDNKAEIKKLVDKLKSRGEIDINEINSQIDKYRKAEEKCDKQISDLHGQICVILEKIKTEKTNFKKIGTDEDICPTCLRPLDSSDKTKILAIKKDKECEIEQLMSNHNDLVNDKESYEAKKTKVGKAIKAYEVRANTYELHKIENKNTMERIKQLKEWLGTLVDDIAQLEEFKSSSNDALVKVKKEIEDVEVEMDKIRKKLNMLDVVKFILSEEGVKSYIVKKMLNIFNNRIAYYLKKMDANCVCIFNEYFEEEIVNERGKICSYFNFSGAEKKNIDLACAFAFMSMRRMQGDVTYNILMFDELLDSSLDETGVELILNIIKEDTEKNNLCSYIITHRKEVEHIGDRVIFLEKKNGITTRIS